VEGRRLNGYQVDVPSIVDDAPWSADLRWALTEAQSALHTKRIAEIAIELFKRLNDFEPEPTDGGDEGEGEDTGGFPVEGDKPTDKPNEDGEDGQGNEPTDKPTDGDQEGDDQGGDKGGQGDDKGSEGGDQPSDGGEPTDENKPSEEGKKNGGGKDFAGGRNVEPSEFIESELNDQKTNLSKRLDHRPSSAKPTYATFEWI
jgi:hypothetical protein